MGLKCTREYTEGPTVVARADPLVTSITHTGVLSMHVQGIYNGFIAPRYISKTNQGRLFFSGNSRFVGSAFRI